MSSPTYRVVLLSHFYNPRSHICVNSDDSYMKWELQRRGRLFTNLCINVVFVFFLPLTDAVVICNTSASRTADDSRTKACNIWQPVEDAGSLYTSIYQAVCR